MLGPAKPNPNIVNFRIENPKILRHLRETIPRAIAEEIINAQPMDEARKAFLDLYQLLSENPEMSLTFSPRNQNN